MTHLYGGSLAGRKDDNQSSMVVENGKHMRRRSIFLAASQHVVLDGLMANNLESRIQEIIARATAEIAGALRGGKSASAAPKRRGRPPGRKSAAWAPVAKAAKAPLPAKAPKARRAKGGRRSSAQVVADDAKLLDYIKSHGGQRSEEIQKGLGLPKTDIASGLQRLREGGKVKMKGVKRGATYTAA